MKTLFKRRMEIMGQIRINMIRYPIPLCIDGSFCITNTVSQYVLKKTSKR
ncbi:hypothetical protein Theba_2162 [Mesotoga prima MesG1.Ag.4.2]|uniref:Uncharacterized protein n=1 Tax=Mesotoga prima MesG1.Ag.4.2 TaxID=660470 RepID=I2F792_9BACT|nr:hypothetical protein Theba_2162 [Mesotoga prima MesG1.Ag.4.2]